MDGDLSLLSFFHPPRLTLNFPSLSLLFLYYWLFSSIDRCYFSNFSCFRGRLEVLVEQKGPPHKHIHAHIQTYLFIFFLLSSPFYPSPQSSSFSPRAAYSRYKAKHQDCPPLILRYLPIPHSPLLTLLFSIIIFSFLDFVAIDTYCSCSLLLYVLIFTFRKEYSCCPVLVSF